MTNPSNVPPFQAGHRPRGWLHRNRWWLPGALVLGALALLLPWRAAEHEYARRTYTHPVEGRLDGWTAYEGARWRLVEVRREEGEGTYADYPHSEASRVLVVFEVIPGKDIDLQVLDRCVGRLSDGRGRHWGGQMVAVDEFSAREQARLERMLRLDTRCASRTDASFNNIKARRGEPFRFFHGYLVPRDLPNSDLSAEILLNPYQTTPPGSYLRFRLPAANAPDPGMPDPRVPDPGA
jgi:hypothetical protein